MLSVIRSRFSLVLSAALIAVFSLAACATESSPTAQVLEPTSEPTTTPLPTAVPYENFAGAVIPPADPERLAQLTKLLSLVPEDYASIVYLDMTLLRTHAALAALVSPQTLGMEVSLPSIATGLVDVVAVGVDFETSSIVTPFQADLDIGELLELAGGFGMGLGVSDPTSYEGHDVWVIDALGSVLAMASADEATGVATSGSGITKEGAAALAEASLDAFDGRSARMLDSPGLSELLEGSPSGFAAAVLSQCGQAPLFRGIEGLSGCGGVVVSADVLPGDLAVFHSLIGFDGPELADAAMAKASLALEDQNLSHDFEDLGVRQEGSNLRVRVIVELPKFADVFGLFSSER